MKTLYRLLVSTLSLLILAVGVSCEEESNDPLEPDRLVINGADEVSPGDTATYNASLYEDASYEWAVPAGATIVNGAGTFAIDVAFSAGATGDITVSAVGVEGTLPVTVVTTAPVAEVTLTNDTTLTAGATGDVLISFDQDIATAPEVALISGDDTSTGEGISEVERVDERTFQVTYTAGTGNGADQISVDNAITTDFYGSEAMDTVVVFALYAVDNTPATGELTASNTPVSDSTSTTISATFSEPLSTSDTVNVSIEGTITGTDYVTEANMMTDDGQTWTYEFQPEGGANENAIVSVGNLPDDPAGNPTEPIGPINIQIKND